MSKEYHSNYYQQNKEHLNVANSVAQKKEAYLEWKRSYMREYNKKYTEEKRYLFNAKAMKRHAAKKHRTPKWLTPEHDTMIKLFYYVSAWLSTATKIPMNVDHIVPLQGKTVSGLHVPWNLRVITEKQNNQKRNKF
jgi:5-methylcytosine-specific restriction endonuclease McrA